jgi:hypothetical protein
MLHPYHKITRGFILLFSFATAAAADQGRTNFLTYGPSAAASGMGEANITYAYDAGAIYHNPALMCTIRDQATASHWFLYDGARYDFVGLVVNNGRSAFGFAGSQFYRDNIEARQTLADDAGKAANSQIAAYGAYAGRFARLKLMYGVSVKWLKYSMYNSNASGFGLDAGFAKNILNQTYSMGKKLAVNLGGAASNIYQTGVKMDTENEKLPLTIKAGLGMSTTLWPKYDKETNKLSYDNFVGEVDFINEDGINSVGAGAQYAYLQRYFLRAGYNRGLTFGFGSSFGDIAFDYAFVMKDLASFNRVGFSYAFGEVKTAETTVSLTDDFQRVYQQDLRVYDRFVRNGEDLIKQERPEDAALVLLKAIPLNPKNNGKAKDLLQVCEKATLNKKTSVLISQANEVLPKNIGSAYDNYMEAYRLTADEMLLTAAEDMFKREPSLGIKKKTFIDEQIKDFERQLNLPDFEAAKKQLALVQPLLDADSREQLRTAFDSRKNAYVSKLQAVAMQHMRQGDALKAYRYLAEDYRLSADAGIKDLMNLARDKYFNGKKYSVEDNIYADKLYYSMAYNLATDAKYQTVRAELYGFNPFYDIQEFIESLLKLRKETPEQFPI